ncbi:MFS transporter [Sphaerulina musiva]
MGLNEKPTPVTVDITPASEEQTPQLTPEIEQQTTSSPSPSTPAPNSRWRRIIGIIWDTFDGTPQERRYVRKLDTFLLSYMCLAYFIKQLDQTNISNAFVSGMQEDLALYGNERNWLNTWFNIGILLGTIPSQLIQVEHVRPSIWLPSCEIFWSILVVGMGFAKNVETLYALRFFVGFAEACCFPGFAALLGGWYGVNQLAKRAALFEQSSAIGNMFSGYLQAALYKGMNGHLGLRGWQWMFVFDGIIGIPIGLWGYFAIPDLPHNTRAFYWTAADKEYTLSRVEQLGRPPTPNLTLRALWGVFTNWRLWLFILPYNMVGQAISGLKYFNLYLKWDGWSVVDINILPTGGDALSVVAALFFGILADQTGWNATLVVLLQGVVITSNSMLAAWCSGHDLSKGSLLFAYYLSYVGLAAQPIVISWGNHLAASDPILRQMLVACGNVASYTWNAWLPLAAFPTYNAPKYDYGYQILVMFSGLAIVGVVAMYLLREKFARKSRRA